MEQYSRHDWQLGQSRVLSFELEEPPLLHNSVQQVNIVQQVSDTK